MVDLLAQMASDMANLVTLDGGVAESITLTTGEGEAASSATVRGFWRETPAADQDLDHVRQNIRNAECWVPISDYPTPDPDALIVRAAEPALAWHPQGPAIRDVCTGMWRIAITTTDTSAPNPILARKGA